MSSTSDSLSRSDSRKEQEPSGEYTRLRKRERDATRGADRAGDVGSMIKVTKSDIADELQNAEMNQKRLEKVNKRLADELKGAMERAERLEDELRGRERKHTENMNKLEEASKKTKFDSDKEIRDLQAKQEGLQSKLEEAQTEAEDKAEKLTAEYEKKVSALTSDMSELKKKMKDSSEDPRIATLEEKVKAEKEERSKLDSELRKVENKVRDLERQVESKDRTISDLQTDLQEKTKEVTDVSTDKDSLNKDIRQLRKDAAEAEDLKKANAKLQDLLDAANADVKETSKKLDAMETEKRKLERDLARGGSSSTSTSTDSTSSRYTRDRGTSESTRASDSTRGSESGGRTSDRISRREEGESSRTRETSGGRESSTTRRSSTYGDSSTSSSTVDSAALKKLEREQERKLGEMEEKMREAELEHKKYQSLYETEKIQREDLEKTLKQDRSESKQSVDLAIDKVGQLTKQLGEAQSEISKLQKAIQKKDRDLDDMKLKCDELLNNFTNTKNALSKSDTQLKQQERTLQQTEKKLKDTDTKADKLNDKLVLTTEELRATKTSLEEARAELAAATKHFDLTVKVLEEELYEETNIKEKLLKVKAELEKELQTLRWYFKPLANQAAPEDRENQTVEFNFAEIKKREVEAELQTLFKDVAVPKRSRTIPELQDALKEGLNLLSPDIREDMSFELEDLMKYMTLAGLKTKTKLGIFVALVENHVDAGIVRELANITADMAEGRLHVMNSPETLIKFCAKDILLHPGDEKAFNNAMLVRLAQIRAKKTGKDVEYCRIVILEGGEYDD